MKDNSQLTMSTNIHTVSIQINTDMLRSYTDEHLASLWHVAQANPAPLEDYRAADLAESIGREIIRRWLVKSDPALYNHQGRHPYWSEMSRHGKWHDGVWKPTAVDKLEELVVAIEAVTDGLPDPSTEVIDRLDDALDAAKELL